MKTVTEIAAPLVCLLPLLILAAIEQLTRRPAPIETEERDDLEWIDYRIRTRPDQRPAWRQVKRLMKEDPWQQ